MKKVAIQGGYGSFHEIAAREYFGQEEIEILPCNTFKVLFQELDKDENLLGIVAIENTIAGSLLQNHNLLRESGCTIIGEKKLRISHQLAALKGEKLEDIREVYSHPIALMQCEDFLDSMQNTIAVEDDDTALSAKFIAENSVQKRAAICSKLACEMYDLEILARDIETNKHNFTRFLIIAKPNLAKVISKENELNKSTIVFTLPHEEGSLSKVLTILSFYKINLTKIVSLPLVGREWEYRFYINLTFNDYERYQQALTATKPLTNDFMILGEYKEGENPKI